MLKKTLAGRQNTDLIRSEARRMQTHKILYTDHAFASIAIERQIFDAAGAALLVAQCKNAEEVIAQAQEADALLVQWAPISAEVIRALQRCKVIVRLGIGVDNVAVAEAAGRGIPVCNVPDYCIDEVADHTVALALALARQIPFVDRRVRDHIWSISPPRPMRPLKGSIFATIGLGRIAQTVHQRMRGFGCIGVAYDPHLPPAVFEAALVTSKRLDEIFATADIISLHCPLTADTHHLVDASRLKHMQATSILINTARGALVDTLALAHALAHGQLAASGLDVFEQEPLPADHPLRSCPNAIFTSHTAWYSERSVPELQRKAAEEIVRGLRGEPLRNQVNK